MAEERVERRISRKQALVGAAAGAAALAARADQASAADPNDWTLSGNGGTNPSTNFIGTTDQKALKFRTNNTERMQITYDGRMAFGTAPVANTKFATETLTGTALLGKHSQAGGTGPGVQGDSASEANGASAVLGRMTAEFADSSAAGVRGTGAGTAVGVHGENPNSIGVRGVGTYAVYGDGSSIGVWGVGTGTGVYGVSEGNAGYFQGHVHVQGGLSVTGDVSKGGGTFKIDHPLDPENRYLSHSFVESPEMLNVYTGTVTTDDDGYATVELPHYFEALNTDFHYQLTSIRSFSQVVVWEEIEGNEFVIRSMEPKVKVSWTVTGVRQDAYARAHPISVEEDKPDEERGSYLHPVEHGQPESRGRERSQPVERPPELVPVG